MKQFDAIIGVGLGGLSAGATLAKKGKKVLVLEQHNIPGGAATCYERDGVRYEVGLHEMDWGTPNRDMKQIIFKKLGLMESLPMITLPQTWRIKTAHEEFTIPKGKGRGYNIFRKYFADMKGTTTTNRALPSDLNPFQFFIVLQYF